MVGFSTTAYLGLSILGWGGFAAFFSRPRIALTIILFALAGVGVLLAALLIPPLLARIQAEERLLRAQFGAQYDAYCARTSRLIPGLY